LRAALKALRKISRLAKQNGKSFQLKSKDSIMKFLNLLAVISILYVFCIRCDIKCKNEENTQWGEESAQLATDKGLISIYALELTKKQANDLNMLEKR
jgi:hypothetical protein